MERSKDYLLMRKLKKGKNAEGLAKSRGHDDALHGCHKKYHDRQRERANLNVVSIN
ncbi:MAG: hypothetical protein QM293_08860 [Bacteroidota bacterium]|nr:hypothetical protein [Bacteroidota bacterium]